MVTYNNATNDYSTSRIIVSSTLGQGNFSDIQLATNAASSGNVVFIMPGTYNIGTLTLKSGVNYCCWTSTGDFGTSTVTIVGKMIDNGVGISVTFENISFETDGDFIAELTGTGSSLQFIDCNITASDNEAFSMNQAQQNIFLYQCVGAVGTTGISFFTQSTGDLWFQQCQISNDGGTSTVPTMTGGNVAAYGSVISIPLGCQGGAYFMEDVVMNLAQQNLACMTLSGTGSSTLNFGWYASGTASACIVGAGTSLAINDPVIVSSNANQIST